MVAEVQNATDQGSSSQVPSTAYRRWIDQEYQALRRMLGHLVPSLYTARVSFTISTGNSWTIAPATWGKLYRLDRDYGPGNYVPLAAADPLDPELIPRGYMQAVLERGGVLDVYPEATATGNYRATYTTQPARLVTGGADDAINIDVPAEFERVLIERVAALVRRRLEEDPTPHERAAEAAMREAKWYLRTRYGVMHEPGMARSF